VVPAFDEPLWDCDFLAAGGLYAWCDIAEQGIGLEVRPTCLLICKCVNKFDWAGIDCCINRDQPVNDTLWSRKGLTTLSATNARHYRAGQKLTWTRYAPCAKPLTSSINLAKEKAKACNDDVAPTLNGIDWLSFSVVVARDAALVQEGRTRCSQFAGHCDLRACAEPYLEFSGPRRTSRSDALQ